MKTQEGTYDRHIEEAEEIVIEDPFQFEEHEQTNT